MQNFQDFHIPLYYKGYFLTYWFSKAVIMKSLKDYNCYFNKYLVLIFPRHENISKLNKIHMRFKVIRKTLVRSCWNIEFTILRVTKSKDFQTAQCLRSVVTHDSVHQIMSCIHSILCKNNQAYKLYIAHIKYLY